jgi:serine/threonine protein kinase
MKCLLLFCLVCGVVSVVASCYLIVNSIGVAGAWYVVLGLFGLFASTMSVRITYQYYISELMEETGAKTGLLADQIEKMEQAWIIRPEEVDIGKTIIGSGGFSTVYQGVYQRMKVAVKVLKPISHTIEADAEFRALTRLRHPNILHFWGAGYKHSDIPFLVYELMDGGNLREFQTRFLSENNLNSWHRRLEQMIDVAKGLKYLHDQNLMHRDLKSLNILCNANGNCKIADFGLARLIAFPVHNCSVGGGTQSKNLTAFAGTPAWMSPEIMSNSASYTLMSDIFSFGIIMWETLSLRYPWADDKGNMPPNVSIMKQIKAGKRPPLQPFSDVAPSGFVDLIVACWSQNPHHRPAPVSIIFTLSKIIYSSAHSE